MEYIFKESEWAKNALTNLDMGKDQANALRRIAGYYRSKGLNREQTEKELELFIARCKPHDYLPGWQDKIDIAIKKAFKFDPIDIDYIEITDKEIEIIDKLETAPLRRLAFVLLCLAKYWKEINPESQGWVGDDPKTIGDLAKLYMSEEKQDHLYYELKERNLLEFAKRVDSLSVKVLYMRDGKTVLKINDFRNLGYRYEAYKGNNYFECVECGVITKCNNKGNENRGRKQKYCKKCAAKVAAEQRCKHRKKKDI